MSDWRMLATRLIADVHVVDRATAPDGQVPSPAEAAEFLRGVHHLIDHLTSASIGIGKAYGGRLPDSELAQFRVAVQHMQAVSLDSVADALDRLPARSRPGE